MNHNLPDDRPARFALYRHDDVHGVSGEGVVAFGTRFPDGRVAYRWLSDPRTTQFAEDVDVIRTIHGHGGKTVILWFDEPPERATDQSDIFLEGTDPRDGAEA